MTELDKMRDKLAGTIGPWTQKNGRWYHAKWHATGSGQKRHPVPESLDWVVANWPGHRLNLWAYPTRSVRTQRLRP